LSPESQQRRLRLLFLNRSYWPDAEATGQLLTELCEGLAPVASVTVIAGQPNVNLGGQQPHRRVDTHHGVHIRRLRHTRFPKRSVAGRLANYVTFLFAATWAALFAARPDVVVVETDPPLLCLLGWCVQRLRGAKLVAYLQDIYPDIAIALGRLPAWCAKPLGWLFYAAYRRADRVIVLSRDMRDRMIAAGVDPRRIHCIPNWIDTDLVRPRTSDSGFRQRVGLNGEFVVMYSGNLGMCQRLEDVVAAAACLQQRRDILFLLIGGGSRERELKQQVADHRLENVRFLPYQPKHELAQSLSAADLHLVPVDPRVASCMMPSKLYGVLASGTALLAIAPRDTELAELTVRHKVGVVATPGQPQQLAEAVRQLAARREDLLAMGQRGRQLAVAQFDRKASIDRIWTLLRAVANEAAAPAQLAPLPTRIAARVAGGAQGLALMLSRTFVRRRNPA
jgi:colanic acid biosynthesis glycosyl transferase WcaI